MIAMRGSPVNRLEHVWSRPASDHADESESPSVCKSKAGAWEKGLESFMGNHPRLALTAAAAVGLLIGWMVKRK